MIAPPLGSRWRLGVPPGVYEDIPDSDARPVEVRMDVAAFVGLCERGPVGEPVFVESWEAFLADFGRPGEGRNLPQAVWAFFANGGRACVVVRALRRDAITARFWMPGLKRGGAAVDVAARDPGRWGNGISVSVAFRGAPLGATLTVREVAIGAPVTRLWAAGTSTLPVGTTLRVVRKVGSALVESFRRVVDRTAEDDGSWLVLDAPVFDAWSGTGAEDDVLGSARQLVVDVDIEHRGLRERWADAALHASHPRFLLRLLDEGEPSWGARRGSRLLASGGFGSSDWLLPADSMISGTASARRLPTDAPLQVGDDRAAATTPDDVLDVGRSAIDRHDAARPSAPITLVDVPDLVHVDVRAESVTEPRAVASTCFEPCDRTVTLLTPDRNAEWPLLVYDGDWAALAARQRRIVSWCEEAATSGLEGSRRIAILAPPPGLSGSELVQWRHRVASDRAAAYAPWLRVAPVEDPLAPLRVVPPCAAVCGTIARATLAAGVWRAPANLAVAGAVGPYVDGLLPDGGFLHETRVNALATTRDGLTLAGSRTTSNDPDWTHVSVRRLLDFLELQLPFDAWWSVFEPNEPRLWDRLRMAVEARLTGLFHRGAFAGATPKHSFFVRCGPDENPLPARDEGRCVVLVGVAPSVPAEFLVFRLVLDSDGTTRFEVPLA